MEKQLYLSEEFKEAIDEVERKSTLEFLQNLRQYLQSIVKEEKDAA